jgi:hypothetical protein
MPDVYKVKALSGQFAAFWTADEYTLDLFLPSDPWEQYKRCNLAEWEALRESYNTEEHKLDSYNETINAAWHFLAMNNHFIDKSEVELSSIEPGKYFPRIWRGFASEHSFGTYCAVDPRNEYGAKHFQSATAASSLFDYLVEIFRHIEPSYSNFKAFGHKVRELLILVCTEVESAWRAVLTENGYSSRSHFNTTDYVRLLPVLRLKDLERKRANAITRLVRRVQCGQT